MGLDRLGDYALAVALVTDIFVGSAAFWWKLHTVRIPMQTLKGAADSAFVALTSAVLGLAAVLVGKAPPSAHLTLPLVYRVATLWGGESSSLLFWGWIVSGVTAYAAHAFSCALPRVFVRTLAGLGWLGSGLTLVTAIWANPFAGSMAGASAIPGLNPLLEAPLMLVHPPLMYAGLVGTLLPAALTLAAADASRGEWQQVCQLSRRWLMGAWICLSVALVLGGLWSYQELGWGGYWAWDPVENTALLPWLTATAWLHLLTGRRRYFFRPAIVALSAGTMWLVMLGTVLTRSGLMKNSVHAFLGTGVGEPLFILWGVATVTLAWRVYSGMRLAHPAVWRATGASSVSGVFFGLLAWLGIAVTVLIGTLYPVVWSTMVQQSVTLGSTYFNSATAPFFLLLIGLTGLYSGGWLRQSGRFRVAVGLGAGIAGVGSGVWMWKAGVRSIETLLALALVSASIVGAFGAWAKVFQRSMTHRPRGVFRPPRALGLGQWIKPRHFAALLAHTGFLVMALGVVVSHVASRQTTVLVSPAHSATALGYRVSLAGLAETRQDTATVVRANLAVAPLKRAAGSFTARPGLAFFPGQAQPIARVAIHRGWINSVYLVLEGIPRAQWVLVRILINPGVPWIWWGAVGLAGGGVLALGAPEHRVRADSKTRHREVKPEVAQKEGGQPPWSDGF